MSRNKRIHLSVDTNLEPQLGKLKEVLDAVGGEYRFGETIEGVTYHAVGEGLLFADWKRLWTESSENGFDLPDQVPVIVSSYHLEKNAVQQTADYIKKCRRFIERDRAAAIANSQQKAKATFAEKGRNKARATERKEARHNEREACERVFNPLCRSTSNVLRSWLQNDLDWRDFNICPLFNVIRRMGGGLVGLHVLIPRFMGMKVAVIVGDMTADTQKAMDRWMEQKSTRRLIHVNHRTPSENHDGMYIFCKEVCDKLRRLKTIDSNERGN